MIANLDINDRVKRLFVLDFGLFKVHSGDRVIGICGYLIQTEGGRNLLIDTGFPTKYAADPRNATLEDGLESFGEVLILTEENLPAGQLGRIGLDLDDIDCLILSHTHIDHVGGIGDYPDIPLVIGEAERALPRPLYFGKMRPIDWPDVETVTIAQDTVACQGLTLLSTPGHSPGHLSMMVDLPNTGPVLLTADAISRPAEIDEKFAGSWNEEMAIASAERILTMAKDAGAFIIYGHDPAQWANLRKAPDFYD